MQSKYSLLKTIICVVVKIISTHVFNNSTISKFIYIAKSTRLEHQTSSLGDTNIADMMAAIYCICIMTRGGIYGEI